MALVEIDKIKGYMMPIHTLPEASWEETICKGLIPRLMMMLSINLDRHPERIAATELMIKDSANRISPNEIEKAFKMYVMGQLPGLEPMDNHLTPILFNKVVTAFKQQKKPVKEVVNIEITEEEKKENAYLNCIYAFDDYIQKGEVSYNYHTAYDILKSKGMVERPTKKESDEILKISKSRLIRECSTNRGLKETLRKVVNTPDEKQWIVNYGKCELLAAFFKTIKEQKKHLKEIL